MAGSIDAIYFYQVVVQSLEELGNDVHTVVKGYGQEGKQGFKKGIWQ